MLEDQSNTIYAWIGAAGTFMFAWLLRLERRGNQNMTRKEHEAICEKQQKAVTEELKDIKEVLREQDKKAAEYREKTTEVLGEIRTKLAVVQVQVKVDR